MTTDSPSDNDRERLPTTGSVVQHHDAVVDADRRVRRTDRRTEPAVPRPTPRALAPAAALLLALTACGGGDDDLSSPTAAPTPSAAAPSTTTSATAIPSPTSGQTSAVAVYYLMDGTGGPRLYREFHDLPGSGDPVADAVQAMLDVPPDDPDYQSLWPDGVSVLGTSSAGDVLSVDLSGEALDGQAGSVLEAMSLQQLVHTATAAQPGATSVQVTVEGQEQETLWGAVSLGEPVDRGPAVETLGPIWILTPTEGGTLAAGGDFGGVATAFEATVNWQWLQGETVVAEGFSTATEGAPGRGDWSSPVEVPPGDYVLKAFESSARDGSQTFVETKSVTVTG